MTITTTVTTVTTTRTVIAQVLILDKKTFYDLDDSTIDIIRELSNYNKACTKAPEARTSFDVDALFKRLSFLVQKMSITPELLRELCRGMKYRKLNKGHTLVHKGVCASEFYVILSGTASAFADVDMRRNSLRRQSRAGPKDLLKGNSGAAGMKAGRGALKPSRTV